MWLRCINVTQQHPRLADCRFADIVQDPTKNVFVYFYAPWCAHSVALMPRSAPPTGLMLFGI